MMDARASRRTEALSMNASSALVEAQRCLQCYDAPCAKGCPVHIDVPGFIKRLAENNLEGANQLLMERNPLATICGLVCPTQEFCEGACVLPRLGQSPIRVGALQYFVASQSESSGVIGKNDSPGRVAIVGGGPSGLGCAVVLRRLGHSVDLYESASAFGGLVSGVIPSHRLPPGVASHDLDRIQQSGVVRHLGVQVDADMVKRMAQDHDAVFLGIGLARSESFSAPGSALPGVMSALEFLRLARACPGDESLRQRLGESVVILGGGNVALDAAVTARRMGVERAIVLYRRTMEEMPGWRTEYMEAASLGVEFRWLSTIKAIQEEDQRACAVEVQPMRRTHAQRGGRRGVVPDDSAPCYNLPCDSILLALGQSLDTAFMERLGIRISAEGTILSDPETFQTNQPKLFAAGEAAIGGSTVVESLAQGMAAGRAIDRWLHGQGR